LVDEIRKRLAQKCKDEFELNIPATQADIEKYYDVLVTRFGKNLVPSFHFLKAVPIVNPSGLVILKDKQGVMKGGVELYGLNPEFFVEYIAGNKSDPDFKKEDILSIPDTIAYGILYCAITVDTRTLETIHGHEYGKPMSEIGDCLLLNTFQIIKDNYLSKTTGRDNISIYAIEATNLGKSMLRDIGYKKVLDGSRRKDEKPLYRLDLDRNNVDAVFAETLSRRFRKRSV
jgi:hypothetical protein